MLRIVPDPKLEIQRSPRLRHMFTLSAECILGDTQANNKISIKFILRKPYRKLSVFFTKRSLSSKLAMYFVGLFLWMQWNDKSEYWQIFDW